ncbi:MAG: glycoside hydrolase family 32 protein [Oscillospiraceae bacterium]|nr:glycoside hydrolase family 32 protein [Oscillospiraceae bacterium]
MVSQILRDARRYEAIAEQAVPAKSKPSFHLAARVGWMNDPNGFSYYKGQYHLFYQYYPYDTKWGSMHWGHAVSDDLLHWNHLPAALAPDTLQDRDGCFSGSAVELSDGRQLLLYTGVVKQGGLPGEGSESLQSQCIAIGDGTDYEKYAANPVLSGADLPEGGSAYDFRDPKAWREKDGSYRCVVGNRASDGSGQLLYYSSEDAIHWTFESVLAENKERFGSMWECPDLFELDGKTVVLISPQDMLPQGFEYHNGNGTVCLIGRFDESKKSFVEESNHAIDYGIDFYAPQTVLTPDGRRVMIAWMQNWDTLAVRMAKSPWCGQMTLPRELSVRNGRLYQWPVRELETLRRNRVAYENVLLEGAATLEGIRGRRIDLTITIRPEDEANVYKKFAVWFGKNDAFHTALSFRPYESILKVDRKFSGSRRAVIHQRRCKVPNRGGALTFRMILDRFSVEIFVNHGEQALTATMFTDSTADGIAFFADGRIRMDVEQYTLDAADESASAE